MSDLIAAFFNADVFLKTFNREDKPKKKVKALYKRVETPVSTDTNWRATSMKVGWRASTETVTDEALRDTL